MGRRVVVVVLETGRRVVVVVLEMGRRVLAIVSGNTHIDWWATSKIPGMGGGTSENTTSPSASTANNTTSTGGPTANNTTSPSGPYNATLTGVPENMKNSNNETAADFTNNILAVHNRERADVKVPALVWSNKLGRRQDLGRPDGGYTRLSPRHRASGEARRG